MRCRVDEQGASAAQILEDGEALLRAGELSVRVGVFSQAAVSVGVAQKEVGALEARASAQGLPFVRRSSGGSSLLHLPGDLYWTLVIPRAHPAARPGFVHRYAELGAGWVDFLSKRRTGFSWACPSGTFEPYCLLSSRGLVLARQGRAVGGASQHVTREALLHHGTVQSTLDPARLSELFGVPAPVASERLTSLEAEGLEVGRSALPGLAEALAHALSV